MSNIKTTFLETRPHFLFLSLTLIMIGSAVSFYHGFSHIPHLILALVGLLAFHISVNVLNDYYDFKTGIDLKTKRTPFSGGSGFLPMGKISPKRVLYIGLISLCVGSLIGIYFIIVKGWQLIPIIILHFLLKRKKKYNFFEIFKRVNWLID